MFVLVLAHLNDERKGQGSISGGVKVTMRSLGSWLRRTSLRHIPIGHHIVCPVIQTWFGLRIKPHSLSPPPQAYDLHVS